jgi:hypothetical protein
LTSLIILDLLNRDAIDRKIVIDLDLDRKTTEEIESHPVLEDKPSHSLEQSESLEDPVTVVESCDLQDLKTNNDIVRVGKLPPVDVIQKLNTKILQQSLDD